MANVNDVVLIYLEDAPVSFARVESILPDNKKDWFHLKLLMLQIPLQVVTWILKDVYIQGEEFTMNGQKMRLETVKCPIDPSAGQAPAPSTESNDTKIKENAPVISLSDFKKRHDPESG